MKKILIFVFAVLISLITGCNVPGTFMGVSDVTRSTNSNLKNQLLTTTLIPLGPNLINSDLVVRDDVVSYVYHIGPQDVLNIVVWNHPELTLPITQNMVTAALDRTTNPITPSNLQNNGFVVDAQGNIFFPYVGKVKVAGLTIDQARHEITIALKKYIRRPQLTAYITGFNSQRVNVIGEVVRPGILPISDHQLKLLDAISLAGGINTVTADPSHIYVIRSDHRKISVYWLNAKTPQMLMLAERFKLFHNDIVYVTPASIISWNRVVSQILPTVQALWETKVLLRD